MTIPSMRPVWARSGSVRRMALLALMLVPSVFASHILYSLLPVREGLVLNWIITLLFAVLFSWISVGFWSSLAGFMLMLRRYDRFAVTNDLPESLDLPSGTRTALLFPVYNEDAHMVSSGMRTVLLSLREHGLEEHFDLFMLSDSTNPDAWVAEEEAWYAVCREENAFGRVFYRRRKSNLKRKSGNIADFCRRWGANYTYMIVFDADSLMAGPTLARMVQIMEAHPDVGIVQTPPKAVNSRSLISRAQQFANHLYGPLFAAGVHYWQLGDAQYWGHNAIIRVEPFMRHCQLPSLPGRSPLGGDILSHDFVESALMRRAGYSVWLAYNLDGSFEQTPPSLIDELARDRRWCQGNLQHSRLLFTRGFFPTHRALFINGIMSYGSALLWFFFLIASSAQAMAEIFIEPDYFPSGPSLFPDWPTYFPAWALSLLGSTAALLFLPKLLALFLVAIKGGAQTFGGFFRMTFSLILEVLVSTLLAPVRMLFHSYFVVGTLLGRSTGWNAQNRDAETSWGDAVRVHWWGSLLGILWGFCMYAINPGFFLWLSPIVFGLALSIPLSVWTSRVGLGEALRKAGLFLTPADTLPPPELDLYNTMLHSPAPDSPFDLPDNAGFARAVVIPAVHALHLALLRPHASSTTTRAWLSSLENKALLGDWTSLSPREKLAILGNAESLQRLHQKVWRLETESAARWGIR